MDYWRPLSFYSRDLTLLPDVIEPVAGVTGVGYSALECIRRSDDGEVSSRVLSVQDANPELAEQSEIIGSLRPPIKGIAMDRPRIMGILNVTPDSFYDGGHHNWVDDALVHGLQMEADGADIIDIGGESTRPGADVISIEEELRRVIPVIERLHDQTDAVISIDTRKAEVMEAAVAAGASMINDVSGLTFDLGSLEAAAEANVPVVLMHSSGTPQIMQNNPVYENVLLDVYDYLNVRVNAALAVGIRAENLIVDPGIGFGKSLEHNCVLLDNLSLFHGLGVPVMLGCSRKSFIGALSRNEGPEGRLPGSIAGVVKAAMQGVQILRVHDVGATYQALAVLGCAGK